MPVSVLPTALSTALPRLMEPVPGTMLVTSTSPMSTPFLAPNVPTVGTGRDGCGVLHGERARVGYRGAHQVNLVLSAAHSAGQGLQHGEGIAVDLGGERAGVGDCGRDQVHLQLGAHR